MGTLYIELFGFCGAGKSTIIRKMKADLETKGYKVLTSEDHSKLNRFQRYLYPILCLRITKPLLLAIKWTLNDRSYFSVIQSILVKNYLKGNLLYEGELHRMTALKMNMPDKELKEFLKSYKGWKIIFVDTPKEIARQRRNDPKRFTKEYYDNMEKNQNRLIKLLEENINIEYIKGI